MADQLPEQNRKHQAESDVDESIQSRQKEDEQDEPSNAVEAKTLTNIFYDCLERIFDFLDLQSLLNVAGTCKRLRIAAAVKFSEDFGDKTVQIACSGDNRGPIFQVDKNSIYVLNLKFCFPFLRCFGAKVSNIQFGGHNDHVDAYINKFCADTLTNITYSRKSQFSTQAFGKPFKRVKNVQLGQCELKGQLVSFVDRFPNIQKLTMISCSFDATPAYFPNLKALTVGIEDHFLEPSTVESFKNLFQSNQQVEHIFLAGPFDLKFSTLLDIINGNKSIMSALISINCTTSKDVTMVDLNRFAAEHPLIESLLFNNYRFAADDIINFIQKMKPLKKFQFSVNGRFECNRLLKQLDKKWEHKINTTHVEEFVITLTEKKLDSNGN